MYSTHNEGKSVIAKRFLRTLKIRSTNTWISFKIVYINKLNDIVNKYNNTYNNAIKMKPAGVKPNAKIESNKEINDKNPKFKIGDTVRISKYKNVFYKFTLQIGLKRFLWLKKLKTLFRGHLLLAILKAKTLLERFMKTDWKKQFKNNLELKK